MTVESEKYDDFRNWLLSYGRDEKTASLYCLHVDKAIREGGFLVRVVDKNLAPKSRHAIMAAAKQWALFSEDPSLLKELGRVRLPPAQRETPKEALSRKDWEALQSEIDAADLDAPVRAVLGMMATRGFRVGDVLRLSRREVSSSLKTSVLAFRGKRGKRHEYDVLEAFRPYLEILAAERYSRVAHLISPRATKSPEDAAYMRIRYWLEICAENAGIERITPHILRHTYAHHFLEQLKGDPLALNSLKDWMQWSKIETAALYAGRRNRDALAKRADAMMRKSDAKS